jgi:hypothetical protein
MQWPLPFNTESILMWQKDKSNEEILQERKTLDL